MRYRILDENGDYSFGKGQQNITYGTYAVSQAVKTRLLLLKEEWWENKEEGLPLFQDILGNSASMDNKIIVDNIIKERISKTQGVVSIKKFESKIENRNYSFSCVIISQYGDVLIGMNF
ncbi:hypothetical protein FDF50_08325 [Clostridium botulinum]|uniref:DUF2634 domain-containing protein n=1 Tax=Clostridium botulinum TaxID=1491 RepID=A0A6G4HQ55_CLOBO|nr:hypothetical protein [Clostridium botulinum]NFJ61659.1 hypothetical protein [Clostridium botulinum]NFQ62490.1 hypothetical protein [Clostridium botulinum]NFR17712.1 hypothetical protein [Clostridium botulinum]NFU16767.1 hypothetical protein [Clostridium botulinum]